MQDRDNNKLSPINNFGNQKKTNEKQKLIRKRKRKHQSQNGNSNVEDESYIDKALEEKLQECAKRNNLSALEIKKLIRSIVGNDHVLAIVKLKEEEEFAKEMELKKQEDQTKLSSLAETSTHESTPEKITTKKNNGTVDNDAVTTTKLTRAKARALNKIPMPIVPLNEKIKPEPEVAALICQELNSDEEDEEYCPKEEDYASDDDHTTTISDIDSQPRTPLTPANIENHIIETPPRPQQEEIRYSDDGLFKLPQPQIESKPSPSKLSTSHHDEGIIAKRTRSKLCLQATPIESIESNFIPPDITTDMYDFDNELDQEWVEFLNAFTKPLNTTTNADDDDDPTADPEYIAVDKVHLDAEELRDVNISKKELSDLIAELFDGLISTDDSDTIMTLPSLETPKKIIDKTPDKFYTNKKKQKSNSNMAMYEPSTSNCTSGILNQTDNMNNISIFNPNVISTPQPIYQQPKFNQSSSTTVNMNLNVTCMNTTDIYQYQEYDDYKNVLNNQMTSQDQTMNFNSTEYSSTTVVDSSQISTQYNTEHVEKPIKTTKTKRKSNTFRISDIKQSYTEKYEELRNYQFDCQNLSQSFNEDQLGFTTFQRQILDQQLRMHVQFATQNFLQTYSHPELWKLAQSQKNILLELKSKGKENEKSAFNAINLNSAIKLITRWEEELSIPSKENRLLMDFFYDEIDHFRRLKGNRTVFMKFPPRIMKTIVQNPTFMYPDLLPQIPFRINTSNKPYDELCPSVDYLLAHAMEHYYKEIQTKPATPSKTLKRTKQQSDLRRVSDKIAKNLITWKSWRTIYYYIQYRRTKSKHYNPIKFYYDRGRAPPFHHVLYPIDLDCKLTPESRLSELPRIWKEFVIKLQKTNTENNQNSSSDDDKQEAAHEIDVKDILPLSSLNFSQNLNSTNTLKQETHNLLKELINSATSSSTSTHIEDKLSTKNIVIHLNYIFNSKISENPAQLHQILNTTTNLFNNSSNNVNYVDLTNHSEGNETETNNVNKIENIEINQSNQTHLSSNESISSSNQLNATTKYNKSSSSSEEISPKRQKLLTDYFKKSPKTNQDINKTNTFDCNKKLYKTNGRKLKKQWHHKKLHKKKRFITSKRLKQKQFLRLKLHKLIISYQKYIKSFYSKFENKHLQKVFIYLKAIELYTNLLKDLKMNCRKLKAASSTSSDEAGLPSTTTSPSSVKRSKVNITTDCSPSSNSNSNNTEDEVCKSKTKLTKANENLKQMLMIESNEETNKKDANYAYNFYERVEEAFMEENNLNGVERFQNILKKFDPKKHRVADLYNDIENLFLPNHPDLLHMFLTFLLPSQAAEIGKFFEYFMLTNMNNFINKLNIYFNKQPSQIKKVYVSLNELSEEENVTMDKIKSKILPLLKGNQFLIDWFLQMFPDENPPKSLGMISENLSTKQLEAQTLSYTTEFISQKDLIQDSPESQSCQIRYMNGRIFYGSRILLPAKLAFLAKNLTKTDETKKTSINIDNDNHSSNEDYDFTTDEEDDIGDNINDERLTGNTIHDCVHNNIRLHAEKIIKTSPNENKDISTTAAATTTTSTSDGDKIEYEDEKTEELVNNNNKYEICDIMQRKHAIRLNPTLYSSVYHCTMSHNTKNKCDEMKSPKKSNIKSPTTAMVSIPLSAMSANVMSAIPTTSVAGSESLSNNNSGGGGVKEKRKSPTKKSLTKSPISMRKSSLSVSNENTTNSSNISISSNNTAIRTAKRLKAMIEDDNEKDKQKKQQKISTIKQSETSQKITSSSNAVNVSDSDSSCQSSDNRHKHTNEFKQKTTNWTRDEDKIILEEVKSGFNSEEKLINRLIVKLPNRTSDEIIQRHQFLMDVLIQLQNRS